VLIANYAEVSLMESSCKVPYLLAALLTTSYSEESSSSHTDLLRKASKYCRLPLFVHNSTYEGGENQLWDFLNYVFFVFGVVNTTGTRLSTARSVLENYIINCHTVREQLLSPRHGLCDGEVSV
jgi:hypothetical protein